MPTATNSERPTFNTKRKTLHQHKENTDTEPSSIQHIKETVTPDLSTVETTQDITPKLLMADRHEALLQMQEMNPFCKCISRQLSNGKTPQHEEDLFTHVKGLLHTCIMDANQKCIALIIHKVWKYTVLVEAHDKLRHQGSDLHILFHQTTILLERNEQEYPEIYS